MVISMKKLLFVGIIATILIAGCITTKAETPNVSLCERTLLTSTNAEGFGGLNAYTCKLPDNSTITCIEDYRYQGVAISCDW